jgi:hypothetical protein
MNFLLAAAAIFLNSQNRAILTQMKIADLPLFECRWGSKKISSQFWALRRPLGKAEI